ncbi:MAG: cytochrome c, partial [Myxococcales bacterium]|nr:cytochrome c [Myxococcales bacterium]
EKLFDQEHCNGCHGTKAKPPGKFPNLFKMKWNDKEYEEAFALIKKGKSPMPGYADKLNDKQIADIIAFVKK